MKALDHERRVRGPVTAAHWLSQIVSYRPSEDEGWGRPQREGADPQKDQSYFLALLNPAQLAAARFPIGDLQKPHLPLVKRCNASSVPPPTEMRAGNHRGDKAQRSSTSASRDQFCRQDGSSALSRSRPPPLTSGSSNPSCTRPNATLRRSV